VDADADPDDMFAEVPDDMIVEAPDDMIVDTPDDMFAEAPDEVSPPEDAFGDEPVEEVTPALPADVPVDDPVVDGMPDKDEPDGGPPSDEPAVAVSPGLVPAAEDSRETWHPTTKKTESARA
jgi:hypothetical protein